MADKQRRIRFAVARLRRGKSVELTTNMGSCQCGSHSGDITVVNGVVMACCKGLFDWQNYNGPAVKCNISYGWGATAITIAQAYYGEWNVLDDDLRYAFSQGTGFTGTTRED